MSALTSLGSSSTFGTDFISVFGVNVPAGALIVVHAVDCDSGAPAGVSDTSGNVYRLAASATFATGNVGIYYCYNCAAIVGGQIHYQSAGTSPLGLAAGYATDMDVTSAVLDNSASLSNSAGVGSGLALTPNTAGCLLTALVGTAGGRATAYAQNGAWASPPVVMFSAGTVFNGSDFSGSLIDASTATETFAPTGGPSGSPSSGIVAASFLAAIPAGTADYAPGNVTVSSPTWSAEIAASGDYAPGNVTVASGNWTGSASASADYAPGNVTVAAPAWSASSTGVGSYEWAPVGVSGPAWLASANAEVAELDVAAIGAPITDARIAALDVAAIGKPPSVSRATELDVAVVAAPTSDTHGGVAEVDVGVLAYVGPCSTSRCQVWKITRADGAVFAYTSLDQDIDWLGVTYKTCHSLTASAAESNSELRSVGNVDLTGILDDDAISEADLYAGLFDDAYVEVWVIPYDGQPDDQAPFRNAAGWLGKVTREEGSFNAEVLGPGARLQQTALVDFVTPGCGWDFGVDNGLDSLCPVDAEALKLAGVPVTGSRLRSLILFDVASPGGTAIWNGGTVIWLTGKNAGVSCQVDTVDFGAQALSLWDIAPYAPAIGDTFDLKPGCPKTKPACKTYNAYVSFGGFPDVPGPDALQSNADSLFTGNG